MSATIKSMQKKIKSYSNLNKMVVKVIEEYYKKYRQHNTTKIMEILNYSIVRVREYTVLIDMSLFKELRRKIIERGI